MSTGKTPATIQRFPVGDGKGSSFRISHGLNNQFPVVQIYRAIDPFSLVVVEIEATSSNEITLHFAAPPLSGEYIVVVVG
jgi:hypothetical protein